MKTTTIKNIFGYVSAFFMIVTLVIALNITGAFEQGDFGVVEYITKLLWTLPTGIIAWATYKVSDIF